MEKIKDIFWSIFDFMCLFFVGIFAMVVIVPIFLVLSVFYLIYVICTFIGDKVSELL